MNLLFKKLLQCLRAARLRARGVALATPVWLGPGVRAVPGWRDNRRGRIAIAASCRLETGVLLEGWGGRIAIERDVFLGPYCVIYGHGGVDIGPETLISMHCCILSSDHTLPTSAVAIRTQPDVLKPTRIGRDVWLGAGVTVLGGVTIGDGCVVGAGAVVSRDLPPFSVALGVPARVVRQRLPPAP
ncbi:MAG TPA: acyltransferase [Opitutaceae bacterium]|nr:acyltransferase [Opitutaceae bacterium]